MNGLRDLLIEIGTEELPPGALRRLSEAFCSTLGKLLEEHHLEHGKPHAYATPRRLAVYIEAVAEQQPDREVVRRGPALAAAYDESGKPTRPAEGFARSCGVSVDKLEHMETGKGSWLAYRSIEAGQATSALLPGLAERALKNLPIPKRMRWSDREVEFVRPVHWVVLLFGSEPIQAEILGIPCGQDSHGHRFHRNHKIPVNAPSEYADQLEEQGLVIVDMDRRRAAIHEQVVAAAHQLGGEARTDDDLLEEVTALVEWPVAIAGSFDPRFLDVPAEALISSMQHHQKYFPVVDAAGDLMPNFITVANIDSKDPEQVRAGNERVIRPRLEDAAFFWDQDRRQKLGNRAERLDTVTFQHQLGSLGDKQARIALIAAAIADMLGIDVQRVRRAASLCKCDLLTSMVFEFPELQGIMGRYYALQDGEDEEVAQALDEQYRPRFAGDTLPTSATGQVLAIADRLDTLVGIFAIGKPPTGDKDPFGLRRSALGILRILIENKLDLDLRSLLDVATSVLPPALGAASIREDLFGFIMDRLRAYYLEAGYGSDVFEAVLARQPGRPLDFDQRMHAVRVFRQLPEAESLAAANKRIRNILRQADTEIHGSYDETLLREDAEQVLARAVAELEKVVTPMFSQRQYTDALRELARLRVPVDVFFDKVMVMTDDSSLRRNRLTLLSALSELFLQVADISCLQG